MQTTSAAYRTAYERAHSLRSLPRVVLEWNHNRVAPVVTPSNGGDATVDTNFPITSIANVFRGDSGIIKSRVGEARTYRSRENTAPQYRTVGPRTNYKYWSSPNQSGLGGLISNVNPQVIYGEPVRANKIVVAVEQSWAAPTEYVVYVSYNGVDFNTQVGNNFTSPVDSKGRITINRPDEMIRGVRISITRLSRELAHANVIEVSARLERDISEFVISASTSRSTDEPSLVFPVGLITSNTASAVLDNTDRVFDRDNVDSPYYGLMDTNVKMSIWYGTDVSQYGGGMEYIPQGVYYIDSWNVNVESSTVEVPGTDFSKFLQQMQMHPVLYENRTPGQIIAEILSSVGYNNYAIDISNSEGQAVIPYVWFTGEDNVWEAIQSICSSVQGTVYTDERGVVRFVSRDKTFSNAAQAPAFIVTGEQLDTTLANLSDLQTNFTVEANKVKVTYRPLIPNSRKIPVDKQVEIDLPWNRTRRINRREYDIVPIDSVLWKPDSTITLRASQLTRPLTTDPARITSQEIFINIADAGTWPWRATVNIEGEIMSYDGKEYRWWKNGRVQETPVHSAEEQKNIDDMQSDLATRHKNQYTGRLHKVKRGLMGTKVAHHSPDIATWSCYRKNANATVDRTPVRMTRQNSEMVLWGYSGDSVETYTYAHRGYFKDNYRVYGTRLRLANTSYRQGTAGMFWQLQGDNKTGYYVEINLSSYSTAMKGSIGEIRVYRMNANGSRRALPNATANAFGWSMPVTKNQWIDIEVTSTGGGTYSVYVNGVLRTSFRDPDGTLPAGTWGPFVRGHSVAAFEYFYVANTANGTPPKIDDSSFQHKVEGGFVSGWADREISRNAKGIVNWYFDDFGPWVHEMRKFQVEFDKVPALDAHVFLTNSWDAYLIEGNRTAFDATFWVANSGRSPAVLSGDDPSVYVGGGEVKQQILLFGQLITEDEEAQVNTEQEGVYKSTQEADQSSITQTNEYAIRKRGVVELSIDSKWIQSRSQAEALGKWITEHWSEPVDNVTVDGFFNPALQLGDLVAIHYPARHMTTNRHRYHVVGISSGFEKGINMSLTLRRVRGS